MNTEYPLAVGTYKIITSLKIKYLLLIIILFTNCRSYNDDLVKNGTCEDAIQNCIDDFINTTLFKKGSFFVVDYISLNDDIYQIRIMDDHENKYLYYKNKTANENKLPSRSYKISNKAFVWWNKNYPANDSIINLLKSHDMLVDNTDEQIIWLDKIIFEKRKSATYYVCKHNLSIFERKISNFSDGKHTLKCPH